MTFRSDLPFPQEEESLRMQEQQPLSSALSKIILQWHEASLEIVEAWKPVLTMLAETDWNEVVAGWDLAAKRRTETVRLSASKGWTIPPWIEVDEFETVSQQGQDEIDRYFVDAYTSNDFKVLKLTIKRMADTSYMLRWKALLLEISETIESGKHRIVIPATLSILEGYLMVEVLKMTSRGAPAKRLEEQKFHLTDEISATVWLSLVTFFNTLFASSSFEGVPPNTINRHWVLHGRSETEWMPADAFRLINALATISWARHLMN